MTYCSVVTVFASVGLTKKRFGHYAILKLLSLRSARYTGCNYQQLNYPTEILTFFLSSVLKC